MAIAALITWIIAALGGATMLGIWIQRGGPRTPRTSKFPPGLIFGHFALAAIGLVIWIIYVITDTESLKWVAFIVLLPVALLGFTMLARWIPTYRSPKLVAADTAGGREGASATGDGGAGAVVPAEKYFPVAFVVGHGLSAVVTLVLVLLTALSE
jgi:manganese efflux pump family protein